MKDSLHAYQLSKRGNSLRVMAEAVRWGKRGARINTISPGIIMTPLAKDELTGPRGEGYRRMIEVSVAGRAGTPDEVGTVGALLMADGGFITGSDFLMDGGVTAAYWYGELAPEAKYGNKYMRATIMYGAGDVRVENVPDARIIEPTDALVTITRSCICGSDLWPYKTMEHTKAGRRMGHEFIGIVEAVGSEVRTVKSGDLVVAPFAWSDGTCVFCREGLQTSCLHGGLWGGELNGGQGEAAGSSADGTLVVLPVGRDDALMPSLLTLSDVMGTGHHAALATRVGPGKTVAVVGDGAVGLCGVIAARRFGAEQIIILGRHPDRIALARDFGATNVVSERGEEAVERVLELTGGWALTPSLNASAMTSQLLRLSISPGRVGVPQSDKIPAATTAFFRNVTISGGPAPARAYIEKLNTAVLREESSPVVSLTV